MARIELVPAVLDDFERILAHLEQFEVDDAAGRISDIVAALDILAHNPEIGRPTAIGLRELVIGRKARGYLALYRYVSRIETVFVLAIRAQREAGYRGQGA
ncbi:MAG: type II toxin-antitoxin system RelE/ParE family toxin [Alphaproteobacteria bacterium]|nr:type II toxin-antitoxin system RelE/ParE family toxin [Alphaproteobacteria bacterium]